MGKGKHRRVKSPEARGITVVGKAVVGLVSSVAVAGGAGTAFADEAGNSQASRAQTSRPDVASVEDSQQIVGPQLPVPVAPAPIMPAFPGVPAPAPQLPELTPGSGQIVVPPNPAPTPAPTPAPEQAPQPVPVEAPPVQVPAPAPAPSNYEPKPGTENPTKGVFGGRLEIPIPDIPGVVGIVQAGANAEHFSRSYGAALALGPNKSFGPGLFEAPPNGYNFQGELGLSVPGVGGKGEFKANFDPEKREFSGGVSGEYQGNIPQIGLSGGGKQSAELKPDGEVKTTYADLVQIEGPGGTVVTVEYPHQSSDGSQADPQVKANYPGGAFSAEARAEALRTANNRLDELAAAGQLPDLTDGPLAPVPNGAVLPAGVPTPGAAEAPVQGPMLPEAAGVPEIVCAEGPECG